MTAGCTEQKDGTRVEAEFRSDLAGRMCVCMRVTWESGKRAQTRRLKKRRERKESCLCSNGLERELPVTGGTAVCLLNMSALREAGEKQKTDT